MMGVTSYIQERILAYRKDHDRPPSIVLLGRLEWEEIMGCKLDEEWSVAGIPVVPDFTKPAGVSLT